MIKIKWYTGLIVTSKKPLKEQWIEMLNRIIEKKVKYEQKENT